MKYLGKIVVITGEKNSGKTGFCNNLIQALISEDIETRGLISPGMYEGNKKIGVYCQDIHSKEKKLLARHSPGWDVDNQQREWLFNKEGLDWGNKMLKKSIPTEILIIDEIGFLELEKDQGWLNAIKVLNSTQYQYSFVVVRPSLLNAALIKWPRADVIKIMDSSNIDELVKDLLNQLIISRKNRKLQSQMPRSH